MKRPTPSRPCSFGQWLAAAAFLSVVLLAAVPARTSVYSPTVPDPAVRSLPKVARQAFECSPGVVLALPVVRREAVPPAASDWLPSRESSAGHSSPVSESLHNRAPPGR